MLVDLIVIEFIEQYSDETPRTGYWILHTWLSPSLALYIFYMRPYKLFSTARSYLFGSDQIFLHHVRDIFYRYNSTHTACTSPILCPQFYTCTYISYFHIYANTGGFFIFYSQFHFFHKHTLCQQHEAIITLSYTSHYTFWYNI